MLKLRTTLRLPGGGAAPIPGRAVLLLGAGIVAALLATTGAMTALWPAHARTAVPGGLAAPAHPIRGTVTRVSSYRCPDFVNDGNGEGPRLPQVPVCQTADIHMESGADRGLTLPVEQFGQSGVPSVAVGNHVLLVRGVASGGRPVYGFYDFERSHVLIVLALVFAVFVLVVGRWRGVGALVGLVITWLVLVRFVLPAVIQGADPLAVSLVGAAAIVLVVLFVAHGVTTRTATAVLGTLLSLALVEVVASWAVHAAALTGLATDDGAYLQSVIGNVRLRGLLLGGVVIGSLGVLNDVTVTQASAVWEIHGADPTRRAMDLYRSGMRVGRDHIASTVYTLVLAYAGAALPTLVLFTLAARPLGQVATAEVVAEEIVRTLVGSIGLIAAVPITTALAVVVSRAGVGKTVTNGGGRTAARDNAQGNV
ncbi:MAG: YibE/F family protein [Acidimicrobiales bacterium]